MNLIKLKKRFNEIVFSGLVLTLFTFLGGGLGYLSQILMGRYLSLIDYGIFSAIFALSAFINSPLSGIMLIYSRKVTFFNFNNNNILALYSSFFKNTFFSICIIIGITILFREKLSSLLSYEVKYIYFLLALLILNFYKTINSAFFNGLKKNFWFGFTGLLTQFLRFILFLACVIFILLFDQIFLSVLLAILLTFVISTYILIKIIKYINKDNIRNNKQEIFYKSKSLSVVVASISYIGLTQLDIFYVNYFFGKESGYFALGAILGKTILYISHGLSFALFPYSSEASANKNYDYNNLIKVIIASGVASLFFSLIFYFFSYEILNLVFNKDNDISVKILKYYGVVILPYSMIYILENYLISKNKIIFAWISILFLPIQFLLIKNFAINLDDILIIYALTGYSLLIVGLIFMYFIFNDRKKNRLI